MTEDSLTTRATHIWAVALTGASLFMITLDNLIVLSTLPSMQRDLAVSVDRLQWVVDAYILSFAVLMLTGAALGDRYGRRRMLVGIEDVAAIAEPGRGDAEHAPELAAADDADRGPRRDDHSGVSGTPSVCPPVRRSRSSQNSSSL